MKKLRLTFFFFIALIALPGLAGVRSEWKAKAVYPGYYRVIGVKDGDTVEIMLNGSPQSVRLLHIDAPEKKQPYGMAAKQVLSDFCYGKDVALDGKVSKDRNGRLLAVLVTRKNVDINASMIVSGYAWHFKKYSKDQYYANLERQARKQRVGLWADPNPVAPWDYRASRRKKK
jgi:endonuclease YncB( thermonuclease family)